ncbi:UNVERIFIED_CONTAM: Retrovirus-related Pol polyprotein from transposon TNT 1-94 [Sesamum radiatum]|uniref:Retrovirus-related Pol polyprotein from transposon TNT 1-94 n=1 Tax=Sesamum radiatum TaxID=300843 RepID=A0AAW2THA6_SESRA
MIMDTNKFNGTNYNDWLRNLRIVLDFENQGYVLDKPLSMALPEGSSLDKWLEDNRKVRSIIFASMTNAIQKQYDMLEDVPSIMLRIKEVYAVPDRHIKYATIKTFFGPRWPRDGDYPQVESTVLVGEASTSKAKGKGARRWKRKKVRERRLQPLLAPEVLLLPRRERAKGRLGVLSGRGQMMCNALPWKGALEDGVSTTPLHPRLGDGKAVVAKAVGSLSLVVNNRIRIELKDYFYVPRYKSEAFGRFKEYKLEVENQTGRKIKVLRPDRGEQNIFFLRNAVFLEKGFLSDNRHDEVLIEESSEEPQHDNTTSFEPPIHTNGVPVLRRSIREAMSDIDMDEWLEAMKSKIDSMGSNQVWTLADPPKDVRPIVCKWSTNRPRVDFEKTYSPVAMAISIRILLVIAAWYDYEIWQMDVKTAFLNGFLEEEIYMDQPEDFTTVGKEQKDMGEASYVLGIKIYRDRSRRILGLTQSSYIEKCTRPDVAYALSVTSRYQACAGVAHWGMVKSILKYLKKTKDMFLIYGGGELILEGYSDASFQSNDDDAKSQSGFVFKLNSGTVAWKSSKQDTTTDSTTEAEYITAPEAVKGTRFG